jgi:hypothetical protein
MITIIHTYILFKKKSSVEIIPNSQPVKKLMYITISMDFFLNENLFTGEKFIKMLHN